MNIKAFAIVIFALAVYRVNAAQLSFELGAPPCRMPAGNALPKKFYDYPWAKSAKSSAVKIGGEGENVLDGSNSGSMRVDYWFLKTDLDNDGWCDWLETLNIPASTGGDRDSVNTFYLGQQTGWRRVGAKIRGKDKPADFGSGPNIDFNFFETASVLFEKTENRTYVVGVFWSRNGGQLLKPGYHIYRWSREKTNLVELNKWGEKESPGNQAYDFFKKNAVFRGGDDDGEQKFDPEQEENELFEEKDVLVKICGHSAIPAQYASKCKVIQTTFPKWLTNSD